MVLKDEEYVKYINAGYFFVIVGIFIVWFSKNLWLYLWLYLIGSSFIFFSLFLFLRTIFRMGFFYGGK